MRPSARLGLVAVLLWPSVIWAMLDRSAWSWDPARIGRNAGELWWTLRHSPLDWPARLLDQQAAWAPLPAWVGQFFFGAGAASGSVPLALHLAVIAAQATTLLLVAGTVRALFPGEVVREVLGLVFAGAAPLFLGMSNQYFAEPFQAAAVAWTCWIAAHARHRPTLNTGVDLIAALSIGLLAKATTPLYLAGPAVAAVAVAWSRRREGGPWPRAGFVGAGMLVLAVLAWYGRHFGDALAHITRGAADLAVQARPSDGWSWAGEIQRSAVLPAEGALAAVAIAVGFRWRPRLPRDARVAVLLVALHAAVVVLSLAAHHNREPRFLLPLLPLIAVGVAVLPGARPRPYLIEVAVALLALQWARVGAMALGLGEPLAGVSHWVVPPDRTGEDLRRAATLVRLTCPDTAPRDMVVDTVVDAERPTLNANTLAFVGAWTVSGDPRRCRYLPGQADRVAWTGELPELVVVELSDDPGPYAQFELVGSVGADPTVSVLARSALPRSVLPQSVLPQSVLPQSVIPQSVIPQSVFPR